MIALAVVGTTLSSGASASARSSTPTSAHSPFSCGDSVGVPWKASGRIYAYGKGYCTDTRGYKIPRIKLTVYLQRYSNTYGWQTRAKKTKYYYDIPSGSGYEVGPAKPYVSCGYPYTTQRFRTRVKVEAYSGSSGYWVNEAYYTRNSSSAYKNC